MEIYSSDSLYGSGLEQHYKDEVQRLRERGGRPNRRLFCYVDEDAFVNLDETSPWRVQPPHKPCHYIYFRDSQGYCTCDKHNLSQNAHYGRPGSGYIIDINGQILVKPDFNGGHLGYRIETQTESRAVVDDSMNILTDCKKFDFVIYIFFSDQKEQEIKSFNELYNRHALYLQSQIGQEFESVIEPGVLRLDLFGEIVSAKGFEYDGLYVHFFLESPSEWTFEGSPIMSGVTHTCNVKAYGEDDVAHFCFPFEYSLVYDARHSPDAFVKWPLLFVEVMSLDSWERHRTEGYGYTVIPNKAGSHEIVINTWRPIGNGPVPELRRFFIGGSPELEDPTYPQQPVATEEKVLSKFYFRTATSGSVTIRLNVVQQCQAFMESKKSKKHARTLLDRLGGTRALDSLGQVMDAFQRARKRMISARETLPTIK
ncbi:predicted protein [Nematostella vectensis]|uniref:Meckel syndrome type 1 protein homolog n=1 Tax=Nematostella vectensis TaxID=45351 RepID=A7SA52_NEMVE|nr:predicted protein [Nematostella vectensis]|eukprot:XP_001631460.1 predicted protein [Nematostella vectensis]